MSTLQISSLTKEYVKLPTRGYISGVPATMTDYTVALAFVDEGEEPTDPDFITGDWEVWPGRYFLARCLVGPGTSLELSDGNYDVWINVVGGGEDIKRKVGRLVVT